MLSKVNFLKAKFSQQKRLGIKQYGQEFMLINEYISVVNKKVSGAVSLGYFQNKTDDEFVNLVEKEEEELF